MNYNSDFINQLLEEEKDFCNNLSDKYQYPSNIMHLLYVIVPAFILKYGIQYKHLLEKCFDSVPIIIHDQQDKIYQAYYFSRPEWRNGSIICTKGIILKNYRNINLMQLLDNLIHEFNHAINSIQNEIQIRDCVLVRTGIIYHYFDLETLRFLKQGEEVVIEEVINTRQAELIIDIIRSFTNYIITDASIQNTIYSIFHSTDSYQSNSYLLETHICRELLQSKTFFSTLEILRFNGRIEDIHSFFDSIVDKEGSFLSLSRCLFHSLNLQKELMNIKWFKGHKINKIKKLNDEALSIIHKFNQNTVYR